MLRKTACGLRKTVYGLILGLSLSSATFVDRVLDKLALVDALDIVRADAVQHLAEQVDQPVGLGGVGLPRRAERQRQERGNAERRHLGTKRHPLILPFGAASQGPGSIGWPLRRNST